MRTAGAGRVMLDIRRMHVPGYEDVEAGLATAVRADGGPSCLVFEAPTDLNASVTKRWLCAQVGPNHRARLGRTRDAWETASGPPE